MITPNEFKTQWRDGLVRNTPASLENVHIPDASKRFLIEASLPRQDDLQLEFALSPDGLATLPEALEEDNLPATFIATGQSG